MRINSSQRKEYQSRINRVFDYIEENFDKQLTLDELAGISSFSKYHFNRIFWAMVGETPFRCIYRLRMERAAFLLVNNPDETISEIAYKCGYADISVFSRNFKSYFNHSPSRWRNMKQTDRNNHQISRKKKQATPAASMYFCSESKTLKWRSNMELNQSVEVKKLPEMTVAYVRHTGPYKGDEQLFERLFNKLFTWAGPKGLLQQEDFNTLVTYHDDPSITDEQKLRMSVCLTVPSDTKVDGDIGKMTISGGDYVVARFKLGAKDYEKAWSWLFGSWFPESGYQPADGLSFEMYPEEPEDGKMIVDICIPVKPL